MQDPDHATPTQVTITLSVTCNAPNEHVWASYLSSIMLESRTPPELLEYEISIEGVPQLIASKPD